MNHDAMPPKQIRSFPMGPRLRGYLRIADHDYQGLHAEEPNDEQRLAFVRYLKAFHATSDALPPHSIVDLLDELVAMGLAEAALDLGRHYGAVIQPEDFRAQLALGVAAMLVGDLDEAELRLRKAQALLPEEPAPYVNLTQIFLSLDRIDEAEIWCQAGLDAEPNHFALWDLLAAVLGEQYGEHMPELLQQAAEKRCAWAGLALAANLITTGDRYLKAALLEPFYHRGERDPAFLIELTAAYGVAGDFPKIPPLIWQAERLATKGVPWQLHVHAAQAELALDKPKEALPRLAKALSDVALPEEAREALLEMQAEALALIADQAPAAH